MLDEGLQGLPRGIRHDVNRDADRLEPDGLWIEIARSPNRRGVDVSREVDFERPDRDGLRKRVRMNADREARAKSREERLGGVRSDGLAERTRGLVLHHPLWRQIPDVVELTQMPLSHRTAAEGAYGCRIGLAPCAHDVEDRLSSAVESWCASRV